MLNTLMSKTLYKIGKIELIFSAENIGQDIIYIYIFKNIDPWLNHYKKQPYGNWNK